MTIYETKVLNAIANKDWAALYSGVALNHALKFLLSNKYIQSGDDHPQVTNKGLEHLKEWKETRGY